MPESKKYDTHEKALSLNLDGTIFGSFAEIGAGQEVARWFLRVGGASGTVAKTISAYDKEVSDQLYGTGSRYVSRSRLQAMLESEWKQLLAQLQATRGSNTRFFAFVDTISARNYSGTNDCHGWVGLRFLRQPGDAPNDLILHINLMDPSNVQQQEAVGILGVNLIYAAHHALSSAEEVLASVFEELGPQRVEIDYLEWSGPAFAHWNRDAVHAFLVVGGYAEAVVFPADNELVPPNELLYRRALVLAPGRFDSATSLHANLIDDTLAELPQEVLHESKGGLGLFCLCRRQQRHGQGGIRPGDFGTCGAASKARLWGDAVSCSGTLYNERVRESLHKIADSFRDWPHGAFACPAGQLQKLGGCTAGRHCTAFQAKCPALCVSDAR